MTLEEFLSVALTQWANTNAWLDEPEWRQLYVRYGPLSVMRADGSSLMVEHALHLANIAALEPRTGAFGRLVRRAEQHSPTLPIYVENLSDPKFAVKLPELGFERVFTHGVNSTEFVGSWCFLKGHE